MNIELKEAALSMTALMAMTTEDDIIKFPARFYGMICDFLCAPKFNEAKKLIKKGFDSGAYVEILQKSGNRDEAAQKAVIKLMNSEFMTEAHAREIVGIWLIALDPEIEHSILVEEWVDECAIEQSTNSVANTAQQHSLSANENNKKSRIASEIEPLLKRMFIFLEEKNWTSALQYAERVLDKDPECSKAYLGKLMADLKVSKEILLCEASTPQISIKDNFKRACKYATDEELKVLKDYEYRNAYAHGKDVMSRAKTEKNFKDASTWFALYPSYKDSKALYDECIEKAETARKEKLYQEALQLPLSQQADAFARLAGYKDSEFKRQQVLATISRQKEEARIQEQQKQYLRQIEEAKGKKLTTISVFLIIAALLIDFLVTISLKNVSSMCRWLWLPLISLIISVIVLPILVSFSDKNFYFGDWVLPFWMIVSGIWSLVRGAIIVNAHVSSLGEMKLSRVVIWCAVLVIINALPYLLPSGISLISAFDMSWLVGIIVIILAIFIDFALVEYLKDLSPTVRWVWLPLIALATCGIFSAIINAVCEYDDDVVVPIIWKVLSSIWGVIRGGIVVVAYFRSVDGWAVLGAVFLCIFMFVFNAVPHLGLCHVVQSD